MTISHPNPNDGLKLREALFNELEHFNALEQQQHVLGFIIPTTLEFHQNQFNKPEITYLSVETIDGAVPGFFVLSSEVENNSVEFRRIVIDRNARGIGQTAIKLMESYCANQLGAKRIWLDVYEDNARGIHIYKKLGYKYFKKETHNGRDLFFYEKSVGQAISD